MTGVDVGASLNLVGTLLLYLSPAAVRALVEDWQAQRAHERPNEPLRKSA